jgi:biotin operon repressor
MQFFPKVKAEQENNSSQQMPKEAVLMGANLELLRELREKIDNLYLKIDQLERRIEERIPEKTLSETTFKQEIVDTEDVVKRIISEIKSVTRPIIASKDQLTIVEQRRIEKIMSILQENGKLSSSQLAQMMGLSRTRCNEYFKQMEELGLLEGIEIGKEKYYKLKD